jgi:hypothetical protein
MASARQRNLVAPMASLSSPFVRNSEFDSFLFAPIGEERNGMVLSVLSALARLDVDPWHEAASLRGLPVNAAIEKLTLLFSSLPIALPIPLAPATVARLIGLLPQPDRDKIWSRQMPTIGKANDSWPLMLYFIVAFVTMCAQQMLERHDTKAPIGKGSAPLASTVDPLAAKTKAE